MRSVQELLTDGWKALVGGLGLADAVRYKALFQPGAGDYARERDELFRSMSIDDWQRELSAWEKRPASGTPEPPSRDGPQGG